ncbi:pyridoxal 5'-phosphate synthase [Nocardia sp. NPDC058705]|uniref:pyridoxine/pyridoxamine 5'-phosphate oxidase n=1 Tax=Nocardia sp. NPDC058705 TaxID=3346609 RepID=UPI003685826E
MGSIDGLRDILRGLPVLKGTAPEFDPLNVPDSPVELFAHWFRTAVDAGAVEPHAMTLSTADADGRPSARVLILKDVDAAGWHFAINAGSRKGREIAARPMASLTFYWPELVRQVRVSGPVVADAPEIAAADFLARPLGSRQMALTARQSQPYREDSELDDALERASRALEADPDQVPAEWMSYAVQPDEVEFWQGDPARRHTRLRYDLANEQWTRTRLWP